VHCAASRSLWEDNRATQDHSALQKMTAYRSRFLAKCNPTATHLPK
jgi:hypothetical protein